jgi:heme exporter protein C
MGIKDKKRTWWKILTVILLLYTVIGGLMIDVPRLAILNETIRNQYFHVPMWFSMVIILTTSMVYAIRYLRNPDITNDLASSRFAFTGIILGILGLLTGMVWARFTWGDWWVNDPKLNSAAICLLIYLAYVILRGSFEDDQQRARVSAVYNIFAYSAMIPLLFILPRLTDSLHPGNGGNPGFNIYDLDNNLRLIFYPAVIGWTLLAVWLSTLRIRISLIEEKMNNV